MFGDELDTIIVAKNKIAGHDFDVVGHVAGQVNGPVDFGDDPPSKRVGARAEGEEREVRHFEYILRVSTVAGDEHASAAVRVRHLATHLAKVGGLHIAA